MKNNMPQIDEDSYMPVRAKAMLRHTIMSTRSGQVDTKDHSPSPAALMEARRAHEAATREPLRYCFGEPLPGRSALDKMKKENRP